MHPSRAGSRSGGRGCPLTGALSIQVCPRRGAHGLWDVGTIPTVLVTFLLSCPWSRDCSWKLMACCHRQCSAVVTERYRSVALPGHLEVFSCWFEVGAVGPAGSGTLLHPLVSPSRAAPWQEPGGAKHVKTGGNRESMNLPACSPPSPACPSICCGGVNLCRIAMLLQKLWQTPAMLPATSCPALHGWQSGKGGKKSGLIQSHLFPCKVGGRGAAAKDLKGWMFLEVPSWCLTDAKREEQAENSAAEVAVSLEHLESPVPNSSQGRGFGCWK